MFSGSLKRLGFMPERFQAAFEAQRVGSECPPYPFPTAERMATDTCDTVTQAGRFVCRFQAA